MKVEKPNNEKLICPEELVPAKTTEDSVHY